MLLLALHVLKLLETGIVSSLVEVPTPPRNGLPASTQGFPWDPVDMVTTTGLRDLSFKQNSRSGRKVSVIGPGV